MRRKYRVIWSIKLEKEFEANSVEEVMMKVENIDCQNDGTYVEDSFEIVRTEIGEEIKCS